MTDQILSPLALRPRDAAKVLSISPRLLWQLTRDGRIRCVRTGDNPRAAVLYPMSALREWLGEVSATNSELPRGQSNDVARRNP